MYKIMGIDYGDARTGVAISDLLCSIVGSTCVVPSRNTEKALADIVKLSRDNSVGEIVVGLPKNMNGTIGPRAESVMAFAEGLKEKIDLPIHFWDERLTTVAAHKLMIDAGIRRDKRKKNVDRIAAVLILQGFLDFNGR